ncbi:glycogen phosphorylase 2 [Pelomyxa schiedti]|nr:glycogen phosphorylase 2 [Pelomyxa schiedti]
MSEVNLSLERAMFSDTTRTTQSQSQSHSAAASALRESESIPLHTAILPQSSPLPIPSPAKLSGAGASPCPIPPCTPEGKPRRPRRPSRTSSIESVQVSEEQRQMLLWTFFASVIPTDLDTLQKEFVRHAEYTCALTRSQLTNFSAFQSLAYCLRDRLIERWKDTETFFSQNDVKQINYMSLEYLMGRSLQNCLTNLKLRKKYSQALLHLGVHLEDLYDQEMDAGLGNGGLGRLAACFLDSLATCDFPGWGYGLRYTYGMFHQSFDPKTGEQVETPDYWLNFGNPWEIQRLDVTYPVRFGGSLREIARSGTGAADYPCRCSWEGGDFAIAVAYDFPVPGYSTFNCLNLRLWSSKPSSEFDLSSFNLGDYFKAIENKQMCENITNVLYPNDNTSMGKALRLKQQHLFVAATLADVLTRFKKRCKPLTELPAYVAIQLNDTHPSLAICEMMRILFDCEGLSWVESWNLTNKIFSYTNHTVLPEALERWPVHMMQKTLPRHMKLVYDINHFFLRYVETVWPDNVEALGKMSIIEENPRMVRMANLALIGSHAINGVAQIHTGLLKDSVFAEFHRLWPQKFFNITNGVTPRRWLLLANPPLAEFISTTLDTRDWLTDMSLLKDLELFAEDEDFCNQWLEIKQWAKKRVAKYLTEHFGIPVDPNALFDVQAKRVHEYKRQLMNVYGIIQRWDWIKSLSVEERARQVVPRVVMICGKAAPGYHTAKLILRLANKVAAVVNKDRDTLDYLKVFVVPNYCVSLAELIMPAADISQHISTAGMEASGTGNMKFALNGGLILGTLDGANIEIRDEIGHENMFVFGALAQQVKDLRLEQISKPCTQDSPALRKVYEHIVSRSSFGESPVFEELVHGTTPPNDHYLITHDFDGYLEANRQVDALFKNKKAWASKSILSTARMGYFSSDRSIKEYASLIWNLSPCRRAGPVRVSLERLATSSAASPTTPTTAPIPIPIPVPTTPMSPMTPPTPPTPMKLHDSETTPRSQSLPSNE